MGKVTEKLSPIGHFGKFANVMILYFLSWHSYS